MSSGRTRWHAIGSREVAGIDIPRACADVIAPPVPMSLRLSSTLLIGLAQALARKSHGLHADCHATWTRILATPWVTSKQGFDPFISATTTVSNPQAITLPELASLDYLYPYVDCEPGNANQAQSLKQLGWLEADKPATPDVSSLTASWSSLTIPEPLARDDAQIGDAGGAVNQLSVHDARLSVTDQLGDLSGDGLNTGFDDASICFDNDGNLYFPSSAGEPALEDLTDDVHTEVLGGYPSGSGLQPAPTSVQPAATANGLGASGLAAKRRRDAFAENSPMPLTNAQLLAVVDASSCAQQLLVSQSDPLEAIETDIICNWHDRTKRLRKKYTTPELDASADSTLYERRITALWATSCYWDKQLRDRTAAVLKKQNLARMRRHIDHAASALLALPLHDGLRQMLCPLPPSPQSSSPDHILGFNDDMRDGELPGGMGSSDSELELGRGGLPMADEGNLFNIDLDIPWLNPDLLNGMQRHQLPPSRPPSVHAESSADTALLHHSTAGSRQSTPASRVPSLDLPSSDDRLDVQSFELAAHNLEASSIAENVHSLDSFLDISAVEADLRLGELNHETRCFRQFALARMQAHSTSELSFGALLLPQHRTRRIAARAFMDMLQVATISVFKVEQDQPYAEIVISLE
ncbi:hypothetical protein IWW54_001504 [Coemansia sp. RSA 2705]|nr:hypothetical protein IWW54_001504 [Coemansia sp. RSA 2705]